MTRHASHHDEQHHDMGRYRHARLEELVREELAAVLRDEAADPALEAVDVRAVTLSVDYRHARVHVAVPRETLQAAERALTRASSFLRARLADAVDLKRVPELRFIFDRD